MFVIIVFLRCPKGSDGLPKYCGFTLLGYDPSTQAKNMEQPGVFSYVDRWTKDKVNTQCKITIRR